MRKYFLSLLSFAILLEINIAYAQEFEQAIPTQAPSNEPLEITAEEVSYYTKLKFYVATGDVIIKQGEGLTIYADRAGFDENTQVAEAEGDVRLITPNAELKANRMKVQLKTQCGLVINGKLKIIGDEFNVYLTGKQIEKLGEDRYIIKSGTYHTCECGNKTPSWHLYSENSDIKLNSSGLLNQAVLFAGPFPIAYFPYLVVPIIVDRKSGFLAPIIGHSSRSGNYFTVPYFWAISPTNDLTLSTTYYELRGLGLSGDYRFWAPTDWRGRLNIDFIEDREYGDRRWDVEYYEDHRFLPTAGIFSHLEFLSDADYNQDFPQRSQYRYLQFLESHLTLYGFTDFVDSYADLNLYQDLAKLDNPLTPGHELTEPDNSATPQRAPEIGTRVMGVNLFDMLILRGYLEALNIDRDHRTILDKIADPENKIIPVRSQRLRLMPEALFHKSLFDLFDFRAFATREDDLYRAAELQDKNSHRGFFEYGTTLTFPLSRAYALKPAYIEVEEGQKKGRGKEKGSEQEGAGEEEGGEEEQPPAERSLAHLIEPGISYTRRPEIEEQDKLPLIDAYDRLPEVERLDLFTNQYLILRSIPYESLPILLRNVELRVDQPVDFYAQRVGEPQDLWAPLESELIFMFAGFYQTKILTDIKTEYNHELGNFSLIGVLGTLDIMNIFDLKADYRHRLNEKGEESINSIKGEAGLNLFDRVGMRAGAILEMIKGITVENHQSISYTSGQQCWKIELLRREVAEPHDINYQLLIDLTGLLQVRLSQ